MPKQAQQQSERREGGEWNRRPPAERRMAIGWRWLKHALGIDGQFERRKTVTQ